MVRRSTVIIAASFAVLAIFEPALCFAAAAPAQARVDADKPRFIKRHVRRANNWGNFTTSPDGARTPFSQPDDSNSRTSDSFVDLNLPTTTESPTITPPQTSSPQPIAPTTTPDLGGAFFEQSITSSPPTQSTTRPQENSPQTPTTNSVLGPVSNQESLQNTLISSTSLGGNLLQNLPSTSLLNSRSLDNSQADANTVSKPSSAPPGNDHTSSGIAPTTRQGGIGGVSDQSSLPGNPTISASVTQQVPEQTGSSITTPTNGGLPVINPTSNVVNSITGAIVPTSTPLANQGTNLPDSQPTTSQNGGLVASVSSSGVPVPVSHAAGNPPASITSNGVPNLIPQDTSAAGQVIDTATQPAGQVGNTATQVAGQATNTATRPAGQVVNTATEAVAQIGNTATQAVGQGVNSATQATAQIGNTATQVAGQAVNTATRAGGEGVNSATEVAGQVANTATQAAGQVANTATQAAGEVVNTATQAAGQAGNTATQAAGQVANTATQTAGEVVNTATQAAGQAGNTATQAAGQVANTATQAAGEVVNTATQAAGQAGNTATQAAGQAANTATQAAGQVVNTATQVAGQGVDTATQAAGTGVNTATQVAGQVVNTASQAIGNLATSAAGALPLSITSNGILVANPSVTAAAGQIPDTASQAIGNLGPQSISSNGVLVANPVVTSAAGQIPATASNEIGNVGTAASAAIPQSITSNGVLVLNPAATSVVGQIGATASDLAGSLSVNNAVNSATAAVNQVFPSITSNGIVIPNPSNGGQVISSPGQSSSGVVGEVAPSVTSNGVLVSNPLYTAPSAGSSNTGIPAIIPASITSNGVLVANPAQTAQSLVSQISDSLTGGLGGVAASITSNGELIQNPAATASGANTASPVSPTIGGALPISAATSGSGAGSGSGQPPRFSTTPPVVGSSTLPNGEVVPIPSSSGTPSQHPAEFYHQASNSGDNASAGGAPLSTTLPNGQVVPLASVSGASSQGTAGNQGAITQPNNPAASQTSDLHAAASVGTPAQSQGSPVPTTGPVATSQQVYPSDGQGPFTQKPTAYDSNTVQPIPSSITYLPSSVPPTSGTSSMSTGLPTGVPLVLYPSSGPAKQPENTDLIQIGFLYPLNYDFVWRHQESRDQIFHYLPQGVAYGLGLDLSNVTMQTLRAWDTTQDLHYVTTLALAWIPSGLVDTLSLALHTPSDKFYNNPDASVKTLCSMINNAIPIRADNNTADGTPAGGENSPPSPSDQGGAPVGGDIGGSPPVKASSVGIGVGVVCGAAAYGAAMFFVARRYKKRRQSHMRSPSMYSSPVMSHVGPDPAAGAALMSGAMGGERSVSPYYDRAESRGSGRSGGSSGRQQISAPVMAENSLGWN